MSDEHITHSELVTSVVTWVDGSKTVFGNSITTHHRFVQTPWGMVDFGFTVHGRLSQATIDAAKARA